MIITSDHMVQLSNSQQISVVQGLLRTLDGIATKHSTSIANIATRYVCSVVHCCLKS